MRYKDCIINNIGNNLPFQSILLLSVWSGQDDWCKNLFLKTAGVHISSGHMWLSLKYFSTVMFYQQSIDVTTCMAYRAFSFFHSVMFMLNIPIKMKIYIYGINLANG